MMADYIPFVNSATDCRVLAKYYSDAHVCRVTLNSIGKLRPHIPRDIPLWIDPAVDAYHHFWANKGKWPVDIHSESPRNIAARWPRKDDGKLKDEWKLRLLQRWEKQFSRFHAYRLLTHDKCWLKEHEQDLNTFVAEILSACTDLKPQWVTIPQLPIGKGRSRVNKRLSEATGIWRRSKSTDVRLILPLIITTTSILEGKHSRDKELQLAIERYRAANADGIWVVDTSINDQSRNKKFPSRYEKLIEFHSALRKSLPRQVIVIGGPYWGVNLILWARGLCDSPAISLGTTYTYHISCGQPTQPNIRVSIPPLKRWVIAHADLFGWLDDALKKLNSTESAYRELAELRRSFQALKSKETATNQVASFFKDWLAKIEAVPHEGRALALYQDLSSAFVLGRQLDPLPKTTLPQAPAQVLEAGKVAEQLMLHCL